MSANIKVKQHQNGQYEVKSGNFTLVQTVVNNLKINDCSELKGDWVELCNPHDKRFKPLFIALHNFKINQ